MPSLRDEILVGLYGGLIFLLNPYELAWGNHQYTTNSIYKTLDRLEKDGLLKKTSKRDKDLSSPYRKREENCQETSEIREIFPPKLGWEMASGNI